jgi:CheY-like chemotaxis protein
VDDDEQLTDLLAALLEGLPEPVTVEVANDDFEAGQKILFFRPHTILLDLIMPGLQGFELCRRIKSNADMRDIRVVVMTAYGTPENFERAMAAGADACLAKPIDKAQLFKTIMQDEAGVMAVRR